MRITIDPRFNSTGGLPPGFGGLTATKHGLDNRCQIVFPECRVDLFADGSQDIGLKESAEGLQHESVDFPLNDRFLRVGPCKPWRTGPQRGRRGKAVRSWSLSHPREGNKSGFPLNF